MKTLEVLGGGAIAVFVLAAIVVGLMELHAPPPAFACPDPVAPCEGCYTNGCGQTCTFSYYDGCCHYTCSEYCPGCPPWQCSTEEENCD
ncbi:MAG: hypothetical protein ACE5OR_16080 [bacterium]